MGKQSKDNNSNAKKIGAVRVCGAGLSAGTRAGSEGKESQGTHGWIGYFSA